MPLTLCLSLQQHLAANTSPPPPDQQSLPRTCISHTSHILPGTLIPAHSSTYGRRRHGCFAERHDRAVQRHHRRQSQRGMLVEVPASRKLSADPRCRHRLLSDLPTGTSKRPSACTLRQTTTLKKEMTPMPAMLSPPHHSPPHPHLPVGTHAVPPAANPRR